MPDPSVAIVAPNFRPRIGGIESFVEGLAASAWPASTVVVAPPVDGDRVWDSTAPFRVERSRLVWPVPPRWLGAWSVVRRLSGQVDLLVCAEWWPAARAPARRGQARRVLMAHGTEIVGAQGRAEASMRRAVRSMDLVVANSDYTAGQVEARIPGCPPVEVLCPGVDIGPPSADLGEVRDRLGLGAGPVVLTAARLVTRKGHVEFARHWPGIEARVPGAQWVVAGDGPRADELRAAATSSVKMVGAVDADTLRALYALADVHLLPGLPSAEVEGFGMAIVEAGAAGTPSVASDLGGTGEALGGGGVLVPGGDMAAMAEAVTELLTDAPRRMDLAGRARRRAEELAWDRVGERFRRIIGERVG